MSVDSQTDSRFWIRCALSCYNLLLQYGKNSWINTLMEKIFHAWWSLFLKQIIFRSLTKKTKCVRKRLLTNIILKCFYLWPGFPIDLEYWWVCPIMIIYLGFMVAWKEMAEKQANQWMTLRFPENLIELNEETLLKTKNVQFCFILVKEPVLSIIFLWCWPFIRFPRDLCSPTITKKIGYIY